MKISDVNKIFEEISEFGLTPNEYFSLAMIIQDKPLGSMKRDIYKRYLFTNNWIDLNEKPTEKVVSSGIFKGLGEEDFVKNVGIYRSVWPPITLPTGKTARCSLKDLEARFKWFFMNYNYDWSTIHKATENYVSYYADRGFSFMRTSGYFIYKEESTKLRTSTLAEWCDNIMEGTDQKMDDYHIDV